MYTIKKGDTFNEVANKFGFKTEAQKAKFAKANHIEDRNSILIDQKVKTDGFSSADPLGTQQEVTYPTEKEQVEGTEKAYPTEAQRVKEEQKDLGGAYSGEVRTVVDADGTTHYYGKATEFGKRDDGSTYYEPGVEIELTKKGDQFYGKDYKLHEDSGLGGSYSTANKRPGVEEAKTDAETPGVAENNDDDDTRIAENRKKLQAEADAKQAAEEAYDNSKTYDHPEGDENLKRRAQRNEGNGGWNGAYYDVNPANWVTSKGKNYVDGDEPFIEGTENKRLVKTSYGPEIMKTGFWSAKQIP